MKLQLEAHTPYDRSAVWHIHDAFYAERGVAAWTAGDVPYAATSNSAVARQHARLFVALARELTAAGALGPDEPVHVLEVGGGGGNFAVSFVDALGHLCGEEGAALAGRLRYVLSDYSEKTLAQATASPALARLVEAGTVLPTLFDMRRPEALTLPGKRGRRAAKVELVAVVFNYICCVSPLKVIRRTPAGLFEKWVRLSIDVDDEAEARRVAAALAEVGAPGALPDRAILERLEAETEWRPLDLARAFASPIDREVVQDVLARSGPEGATLHYPHVFLDLLRALRPRLRPGGVFLVNDFGSPDRSEAQSPTNDRAPVRYGLSLAHDVDFVVFDAFAAREGLSILRTDDALFDLQTVVLRDGPDVPAPLRAAFERTHRRRAQGQELLDLSAAAAASFEGGRFTEAARLYRLCLRLAPRSPHVIHRYAQACLATRLSDARTLTGLARRLRRGRRSRVKPRPRRRRKSPAASSPGSRASSAAPKPPSRRNSPATSVAIAMASSVMVVAVIAAAAAGRISTVRATASSPRAVPRRVAGRRVKATDSAATAVKMAVSAVAVAAVADVSAATAGAIPGPTASRAAAPSEPLIP